MYYNISDYKMKQKDQTNHLNILIILFLFCLFATTASLPLHQPTLAAATAPTTRAKNVFVLLLPT